MNIYSLSSRTKDHKSIVCQLALDSDITSEDYDLPTIINKQIKSKTTSTVVEITSPIEPISGNSFKFKAIVNDNGMSYSHTFTAHKR